MEQNADRRWLQLLPELEDAAQGNTDQAVSVAMQGLDNALNVILRALGTTGFVLTIVTTVPIYFLFFAWHYLPMLRAAKDLLPDQHRDPIIRTLSKIDRVVGGFIRGRLIVMVAMMFMFSVGFWLANVPDRRPAAASTESVDRGHVRRAAEKDLPEPNAPASGHRGSARDANTRGCRRWHSPRL